LDPPACAEDEIWCWLSCSAVRGGCGKAAACIDTKTDLPWDGTSHCLTCQPECVSPPPPPISRRTPASPSPSSSSATRFCGGSGTDMHMDGFQWLLSSDDCIIFLFSSLDTSLKFWLSVVITVSLGVCTEFVGHARRSLARGARRQRKAKVLALYTLQVCLGYLLMLVAMTYQLELFLAVLLGLALGHALFSLDGEGGRADPCCVEPIAHTIAHSQPGKLASEMESGAADRAERQAEPRTQSRTESCWGSRVPDPPGATTIVTVRDETDIPDSLECVCLRVHGMTCEACKCKVTNTLLALPAVSRVHVDLDTKMAKVYTHAPVPVITFEQAVDAVGFRAEVC